MSMWKVALVLVTCAGLAVAEPLLEKRNIFSAGEGDYDLYRIPGLVVTTQGTVLAYCEARMTAVAWAGADWTRMDVLMRRSTDGGRTWGPVHRIVTPPDDIELNPVSVEKGLAEAGDVTVNNLVAIVDSRPGVVHFVYCVEYMRCFYMRSDDDGLTFSTPVEITASFEQYRDEYDWRVLAVGPGHGLQLASGRLLATVWMSTGERGNGHDPSVVSTIYSDDLGVTWECGEVVGTEPVSLEPSEAVLVELADGRIMMNMRNKTRSRETRERFRAVTLSSDGGKSWGPLRFDRALVEPVCMGNLTRLTLAAQGGRNRILFSNPHNPKTRERKNLTLKLSYDEGETWPIQRALEPGRSGYSDLAVCADGTVLCFYERDSFGQDHMNTAHLAMARFNLEWLLDERDEPEG